MEETQEKNLDVVFNICVSESRKVLTVLMRGSCHITYTNVTAALFLTRVSEYPNKWDNVKPI